MGSGRSLLLANIASEPLKVAMVAVIATLGAWAAMALAGMDADSPGSGIPQMKAVLEGHHKMRWARVLWVKFFGALLALGSGLTLGREGPTVQMGGASAIGVAEISGATAREQRALTAAGSGAGLAAAFNAPLAGVTFVLEELQRDFQPVVFVAALLSASIATVISRLVSGQFPVFAVGTVPTPPLRSLPVFLIVGAAGGLFGVLFNRALLGFQAKMSDYKGKWPLMTALVVGLALGGAYLAGPELLGGGHDLSERAIAGQYTLGFAILAFAIRFLLIPLCYGTGVPGGIFAPLLSLGALLGVVTFHIVEMAGLPLGVGLASCAVAGMCALFSGIVRAPLTGVILIGEMTASYDLLLPLLLAAFTAYLVAEMLNDMPIYEALLLRISETRGFLTLGADRQLVEFHIQPGSTLAGKTLKKAELPAGVLVILCTYDGREFVPKGDTMLLDHMKIAIVTNSRKAIREVETLTRG